VGTRHYGPARSRASAVPLSGTVGACVAADIPNFLIVALPYTGTDFATPHNGLFDLLEGPWLAIELQAVELDETQLERNPIP